MQSLHTFEDQNVNMLSYRGNSIQITIVKEANQIKISKSPKNQMQFFPSKRHYEFVL